MMQKNCRLTLAFRVLPQLALATVSVPRQTVEWDHEIWDSDEVHCEGGCLMAVDQKREA